MKKLLLFLALINFATFANAQCQAGYTSIINGDTVTFYDSSTHSLTVYYEWTFGDGSDSLYSSSVAPPATIKHHYQYAGNYQACVYIHDTSSCYSSYCDTVTITSGLNYPCSASYTVSYSSPKWFQANLTYPYAVNWFWSFGDGTYDSTGSYQLYHHYQSLGNYLTCLTIITNAGDTCTFCDTVKVVPCSQSTSFIYSINNNFVTFTSSAPTGGFTQWSFGDSTGYYCYQNFNGTTTHTYQHYGTHEICVIYNGDDLGCTYCDSITITNTNSYPCNALFSYYPDTLSNNSIYYYDQSTANIISRNWSFPGGAPSSSNSSSVNVTYPSIGTYLAYLTVTNQTGISCSYTDTIHVGSNCTNTQAYFIMNPTSTPHLWNIVNQATGAPPISYLWNWGDSTSLSTGANPSHTYSQAGWYNICLSITDANGCGSSYCNYDSLYKFSSINDVINVIVISTDGINDISLNDKFFVYPNPAVDNLIIEALQKATIEISNIEGQIIKRLKTKDIKTDIDISDFASGVYIIRAMTDSGITTRKFIKE